MEIIESFLETSHSHCLHVSSLVNYRLGIVMLAMYPRIMEYVIEKSSALEPRGGNLSP